MELRSKRVIALIIFILFGLTTCVGCVERLYPKRRVYGPGPQPPKRTAGPASTTMAEREMLREAEHAHSQGRHTEALAKYQDFLTTFPDSKLADSALIHSGQLAEIIGQKTQAIESYQILLKKYPQSRFADEAGRRLAGLYLEAGSYARANEIIGALLARTSRADEKARLYILQGRANLGRGNRGEALDLFNKALGETSDPSDKDDARRGILASVQAMNIEELIKSQTLFGRNDPGSYVAYVLAVRLYEQGRIDESRTQAEHFLEIFPNDEHAADARALLQALEGQGRPPTLAAVEDFSTPPPSSPEMTEYPLVSQGPVGDYNSMDLACILPLSGEMGAPYGKKVLLGLQLAFKVYQARTPGFKSNLVVMDSKGDPAEAVELVRQAAANPNVLAVVGPVLSKTAPQAAMEAEANGLPMLAITQKEGIPQTGYRIFRLFLTPEDQARAVARYAVQILGLRRLAVLYPQDEYGQAMRGWFADEVRSLGGEIVREEGYENTVTDFSPVIERFAGVGKAMRRVGAGRKVRVDFEAVFLPDSFKAVAMIAPQFAYHDITAIRLLGTSLWHTPRLLSSVARYTQQSVIPTAFFPGVNRPEVNNFIEAYRQETGNPDALPDQFEAYGFDAGMLMLTMMDQRHVSSRDGLVQALSNMAPFPGVTGRFNFAQDGEYRSDPVLITVEETQFKLIQ